MHVVRDLSSPIPSAPPLCDTYFHPTFEKFSETHLSILLDEVINVCPLIRFTPIP